MPQEDWRFLSQQDRDRFRQLVRDWLAQPDRSTVAQVVPPIVQLAADRLVNDAYKEAYGRAVEVGAPQDRRGPEWQRHQDAAAERVTSSIGIVRDEVRGLVQADRTLVQSVINATMAWWVSRYPRAYARSPQPEFDRNKEGETHGQP